MDKSFKNKVFISYSHKDEKYAKWLQMRLENFRLSLKVQKENPDLPIQLREIWRDDTHCPTGALSEHIKSALNDSEYVVVICSPNAAKSEYVSLEINYFINLGREDYIHPYIVCEEDQIEKYFPKALLNLQNNKNRERLGANLKKQGKDLSFYKLLAGILNTEIEPLWRHYLHIEKKKKIWKWIIISFIILFLSTIGIYFGYTKYKISELYIETIVEKAKIMTEKGSPIDAIISLLGLLQLGENEKIDNSAIEGQFRLALDSLEQQGIELVKVLPKHEFGLKAAAFNPNGTSLITVAGNGKLQEWDENFTTYHTIFKNIKDTIINVEYRNDGKQVLLVTKNFYADGNNPKVYISDSKLNNVNLILKDLKEDFESVKYYKRPNQYLVKLENDSIIIWDEKEKRVLIPDREEYRGTDSLLFKSPYKYLKSFTYNDKIIVNASVDVSRYTYQRSSRTSRYTACITISMKESMKLIEHKTSWKTDGLTSPIFSPDGQNILYGASNGTGIIFKIKNNEKKCDVKIINNDAQNIILSNNARNLITNNQDRIKIYDINTGELLREYKFMAKIGKVVISPDNNYLGVALEDSTLNIVDVKEGKELMRIEIKNKVRDIAFSTDSRKIAIAYIDSEIIIGDLHNWKWNRYKSIKYAKQKPLFITFSPNNHFFACITDLDITVWNVHPWLKMGLLTASDKKELPYRTLSFNPQKQYELLMCGSQSGINILNSYKAWLFGIEEYNNMEHKSCGLATYSPDGYYVATMASTYSSEILIYDTKDYKLQKKIHVDINGDLKTLYFSSDGHIYGAFCTSNDTETNRNIKIYKWYFNPSRHLQQIVKCNRL